MSVADDLAPVTVLDTAGRPVTLGALWSERPVALVFIRHYG
jgi:hypothetical protein